ncbi:glycerate kinase [Aeromicrobium sp. CTD01-1L150]|uniref:glycerate kinase n=1 Tax=Aeromicrobium sp. CTD01-1L150 TaxID=3341830 RepID=UPI0035C1D9B5
MSAEARQHRPTVVLAPDKFKGTLTAAQAASAMADGVRDALPQAATALVPMADGGEGTVDAVVQAGACEHVLTVTGALGDPVTSRFAVRGTTAVVEAAEACGLQLISPSPRTSLQAHSLGVGQLIGAALDHGVDTVVVTLGGVSTTDGGAGLLAGLGARLLDADGTELHPAGALVAGVGELDLSGLHPGLRHVTLVAATDVDNPLTGPDGAAAVYGPQKGAGPDEVAVLDAALTGCAASLRAATGIDVERTPGAGAAGGLGAALLALGARVESGLDLVLEAVGLDDHLRDAALVVTGEGRLDAQSLRGKVPVGVSRLARSRHLPVLAVAGVVDGLSPEELGAEFDGVWSMSTEVGSARAMADPDGTLREVTAAAVRTWSEGA